MEQHTVTRVEEQPSSHDKGEVEEQEEEGNEEVIKADAFILATGLEKQAALIDAIKKLNTKQGHS